jgi:hypothetical protein
MKGQQPFHKWKGARWAALGSGTEGRSEDAAAWRQRAAEVEWRLDLPELEDNKSGELGRKAVWIVYCCGDQITYQNRMGWEKEIL